MNTTAHLSNFISAPTESLNSGAAHRLGNRSHKAYLSGMGLGDFVKGAISSVKDAGSGMAVEKWLEREIAPYGQLLGFKLNSTDKSILLNVHLKGETHNVEIHIQKYEVVSQGGKDYIVVRQATASREWLRSAAQNFLIGRKLEIPAQYAGMAKMVL